ncbi:hypothetical protein F4779DRAFT_368028 [Xylariaceae sp. FL0662B]|nr:hypothetical protein F4779DRAFT_368028 [Xylariaceae sp. FL0662B]
MVGFSSWFSRGARKSTASSSAEPSSDVNKQGTDKIIRGRVTKHFSSAKAASPSKRERYQELIDIKEEESDGEPQAMAVQPTSELRGGAGSVLDSIEEQGAETQLPNAIDLLKRFNVLIRDHRQLLSEQNRRDSTRSPSESSDSEETDLEYDPEDGWRIEQVFLNQILNARNEYTLMPSTWRMHFRGIPLPDGLFYIKTQSQSVRPRIYARSDRLEYRGAIALRKLIDIHGRIRDLRRAQAVIQRRTTWDDELKRDRNTLVVADIVRQIRRTLEEAIHWAGLDGDTAKYGDQLPPNVGIIQLRDDETSDNPDSEKLIQEQMSALGMEWRHKVKEVPKKERPKAPVIFGFVIFKHVLFIVTMDADDPDAMCHIPCQLNMAEQNQHQWNALAIMVTICWARDLLVAAASKLPNLTSPVKEESSDPDA